MNEWIAIETQPIPKDGVPVLVYLEEELFKSRIHAARFTQNMGMIASNFHFDCPKPTHWRPMIEGPKGT